MRILNERWSGRNLDLTDGIKVFEERGWAQALPDPDEPVIHLYAEGETRRGLGGARRASCGRSSRTSSRAKPLQREPRDSTSGLDSRSGRQRLKFHLTLRAKGCRVEPLPDLASLSDEDLKGLIDEYTKEEQEVSYQRRLLHGKIDILRAELVARLQKTGGQSVLDQVDVESLTEILAGKATPPS